MKVGILGSGNVGQALAKGFASEGHEVYLATRESDGDKGTQLKQEIAGVTVCDFAQAAGAAELAVLCTPWDAAADALRLADAGTNLQGKVLIDTNNPIDHHEDGVTPVTNLDSSAGETVQNWLPGSSVVKCFNTTGAANMYKPQFAEAPTMFLCGNDAAAKEQVGSLAQSFGWEVLDAGGIEAARQLEAMAVIWINYMMRVGDPHHAFKML